MKTKWKMMMSRKIHKNHDFSDFDFIDLDYETHDFRDNHFFKCNFSGSHLSVADFSGASFFECDFQGATVNNIAMRGARFERCQIQNATFMDVGLDMAEFTSCDLSGTVFRSTSLNAAQFASCNISEAIFAFSDMATCLFRKTPFSSAYFEKCRSFRWLSVHGGRGRNWYATMAPGLPVWLFSDTAGRTSLMLPDAAIEFATSGQLEPEEATDLVDAVTALLIHPLSENEVAAFPGSEHASRFMALLSAAAFQGKSEALGLARAFDEKSEATSKPGM